MRYLPLFIPLVLVARAVAQEPSVQLESKITGNQDTPRVMYIVPWRQSPGVEFDWEPEPEIAGELFQSLRRDEYRRSLHYREVLSAPGAESDGNNQTLTDTQRN